MTFQEALRAHGADAGIDTRDARLLLAHAMQTSEATVLAFPEREIPETVRERLAGYVSRRRQGEPVAYIVGEKEFYGLPLAVTPAVLVPRPETELLVELALEREFAALADLGTGSGAVALAVKKHRPAARVVGVDASAEALEVARRNAAKLGLAVDLRHGDWCEPLGGELFQVIVGNPPYVAVDDPHLAELRFEPAPALIAGADGLDAVREIVRTAPAHLTPGGWLLLEHGFGQGAAVRRLLADAGLEETRTWPDLAGIPRVSGARR